MKKLLLVDGYNIIGAWSEAQKNLWPIDECRDRLIHLLQDYAGYTDQEIWLIFDGYKAERLNAAEEHHGNITVVYTKHGITADQYIERQCQILPKYREARVATSDRIEQTLILGRGATRLSARELWSEIHSERSTGRTHHKNTPNRQQNSFTAALSPEQYEQLEKLRRGKA